VRGWVCSPGGRRSRQRRKGCPAGGFGCRSGRASGPCDTVQVRRVQGANRNAGNLGRVASFVVRASGLTAGGTTLVARLAEDAVQRLGLIVRLSGCTVRLSAYTVLLPPSSVPGSPFTDLTPLSPFSRASFTDSLQLAQFRGHPSLFRRPQAEFRGRARCSFVTARCRTTRSRCSSHNSRPGDTAMNGTLFALWLRARVGAPEDSSGVTHLQTGAVPGCPSVKQCGR
jgi:hypothetical protein